MSNCTSRLLATLIVAIGVVAVPGCRGGDTAKAPTEDSFKAALMTPGPISDDGWNASAYEGLQLIKSQLGAEVAHKESTNEGEFKQDFRDFARRDYDIIFGHGFEFSNHARDVAAEFPDTYFVTTGGLPDNARANYAPVVFVLDEAMYLLGVIAGDMTTTNKLGLIGGQEIPPVTAAFDAFMMGARSVNPGVTFTTSYVGNWHEAVKAREQAAAQIREGADFIVQNADKGGLGVFQAVKEARDKGRNIYAFGTNRNQNGIEPTVVIASAVSKIPEAFANLAKQARDGEFEGRLHHFTLTDGWVTVVINPELESSIPDATKSAVDTARTSIKSGAIQLISGDS